MKVVRRIATVVIVAIAAACGGDSARNDATSVGPSDAPGTTGRSTPIESTDEPATAVVDESVSVRSASSADPSVTSVPPTEPDRVASTEVAVAAPAGPAFGDSIVVALGLDDGLPRWTAQPLERLRGVTYPVGVDGRVIVQSAWCQDNTVAALDAATGELLWLTDPALEVFEFSPSAASIIDADGVLVTMTGQSQSASVTAIDTTNGQQVWSTEPSPERGFMLAESPSIVAGWSVPLGTVWVLDRRDGAALWSVPVGEPIGGAQMGPDFPAVAADDQRLFVIVGDTLTAYAAMTGDPLWTVANPAWTSPPAPIVASSDVVVTGSQEGIVAYDAGSGEELWRRDEAGAAGAVRATTIADGNIYLDAGSGTVALDITSGETRWDSSTGAVSSTEPLSGPTGSFGTLVAAVGNGRVLEVGGDGAQLRDAASGGLLWGPTPSPVAARFSTIGPDAVLIGSACGGG